MFASPQSRLYQALEGPDCLTANDQPKVDCQLAVGIPMAVCPCAEMSHAGRGEYDMLSGAVEEWHEDEIPALRFVPTLRERTVQYPSRLGSA